VYQAGTLSGNPLATAAGLAVLGELDDDAYVRLRSKATKLASQMSGAFTRQGITAQVPVCGTLVGLYFGDEPATDYDAARRTDEKTYARFFHELLARGVAIAPGAYEVLFPGLAHTDDDLDQVGEAAADAARALAG
jgi:glutamate-1-semialdehyde 2,1-aminomutase